MRCQFCGWDNPEGKDHCEKCNKPLCNMDEGSSANGNASHERLTERQKSSSFNPKATVRENAMSGSVASANASQQVCPDCGFTLEDGECANCGYTSKKEAQAQDAYNAHQQGDVRKTVRPQRKGEKEQKFSLTPISEDTGLPEGDPIAFEGNCIDLSRNNTAPKNSTITSHTQATIAYHEGKWSIEDKSEYKTTFVQAFDKIEIQQGTLILLGNQLYRFDN